MEYEISKKVFDQFEFTKNLSVIATITSTVIYIMHVVQTSG